MASGHTSAVGAQARPRVGPSEDAEQRPDGQVHTLVDPGVEVSKPQSCLAAFVALAMAHQQRAATRVNVGLGERQRLGVRSPARHNTTIRPRITRTLDQTTGR